ncbi:MAG: DNA-protecting protein DprA [Proteobacteria bacterium]|nr:DNA-protecting protein DprA [Pseudomonadota bacterium]
MLSAAERRDRLRLIRSENVGPVAFYQLLRRFGSATDALAALPELSRRGGRSQPLKLCPNAEADAELATVERLGARLVAHGEAEYPPALAAIEDAPPLLTIRGHGQVLRQPMIAVVGARNASANGIRFARELAAGLGRAGLVVVSGLARGIDTAAHQGALASGTVAVMAGGVDVIYPPENERLYADILAQGAVISEMPVGLVPRAQNFPRRNRLISGAALGVIVVEAAIRSGSLITARFALEQGREVFAVPGSPLDPRARGSNDLIRQGATLTEGVEDVLKVLENHLQQPLEGPSGLRDEVPRSSPASPPLAIDSAREAVMEKLGPSPTPVDEIIRQCQLSPPVALTVLLELELAGRLTRHPGGLVSLQA